MSPPKPKDRHITAVYGDIFDGPRRTRVPVDGETCSCGQPAIVVYVTTKYGDVASCQR